MTDFITARAEADSNVMSSLPRSEIRENAERFMGELDDLGSTQPTILTFGERTRQLVIENVPTFKRGPVIPLPHYSYRMLNRRGDYCQALWRCLPSLVQGGVPGPIGEPLAATAPHTAPP